MEVKILNFMVTIYESSKDNIEDGKKELTSDNHHYFTPRIDHPVEIKNEEIQFKNELGQSVKSVNIDSKFSIQMLEFLAQYDKRKQSNKIGVEGNIKVNNVLGSVARAYEKIRTTVEYKGEHVLRRNAIERILKRLAWEKESLRPNINTEKIAENLIKEIIWAGYLKNDTIPSEMNAEIFKIVSKYFYLLENLDNIPQGISTSRVRTWIWGVASSEIEDVLDPSNRDLYVNLMMEWFKEYFEWRDGSFPEHEKDIQIYLAIHRAYPKSDDAIMRYHLLLREFPNWQTADKTEVNKLIINFPRIYKEIENHLNFSGRYILYRKIQKHSAAFEILRNLIDEKQGDFVKTLDNEKKLEKAIIDICDERYGQVKKKVNTGIIRSIIYIFITKVIFALLLEVPYEVFKFGDVRYIPLSINIFLPPILMFVIGLTIKTPGGKNTQLIIEKINSIVYKNISQDKMQFSLRRKNSGTTLVNIFSLLYMILFIAVFGGITYLLIMANFSIFGGGIFFVFLSLVMLFAFRVRYQASLLRVEADKEGFISHLTSYLTLPLLNFGFFLARGFAKFNFFTIILDFIIEAPLKSVIEIFEEWTSYVREKKEEVIEMPE